MLFGPFSEPIRYRRKAAQRSRDVSAVLTTLGSVLLCGPVIDALESGTAGLDEFSRRGELAEVTERLEASSGPAEDVALLESFFAAGRPGQGESRRSRPGAVVGPLLVPLLG
jgi:hypothetical protein